MSALVTNFSSDGQKRTVSFLSYSYQWPLCVLAPDAEPRQPGCSFWGQKIKAQGKAKIRSPTRGTADLHDRHERILSPLRAKHSGAQSRGGDGRGHTSSGPRQHARGLHLESRAGTAGTNGVGGTRGEALGGFPPLHAEEDSDRSDSDAEDILERKKSYESLKRALDMQQPELNEESEGNTPTSGGETLQVRAHKILGGRDWGTKSAESRPAPNSIDQALEGMSLSALYHPSPTSSSSPSPKLSFNSPSQRLLTAGHVPLQAPFSPLLEEEHAHHDLALKLAGEALKLAGEALPLPYGTQNFTQIRVGSSIADLPVQGAPAQLSHSRPGSRASMAQRASSSWGSRPGSRATSLYPLSEGTRRGKGGGVSRPQSRACPSPAVGEEEGDKAVVRVTSPLLFADQAAGNSTGETQEGKAQQRQSVVSRRLLHEPKVVPNPRRVQDGWSCADPTVHDIVRNVWSSQSMRRTSRQPSRLSTPAAVKRSSHTASQEEANVSLPSAGAATGVSNGHSPSSAPPPVDPFWGSTSKTKAESAGAHGGGVTREVGGGQGQTGAKNGAKEREKVLGSNFLFVRPGGGGWGMGGAGRGSWSPAASTIPFVDQDGSFARNSGSSARKGVDEENRRGGLEALEAEPSHVVAISPKTLPMNTSERSPLLPRGEWIPGSHARASQASSLQHMNLLRFGLMEGGVGVGVQVPGSPIKPITQDPDQVKHAVAQRIEQQFAELNSRTIQRRHDGGGKDRREWEGGERGEGGQFGNKAKAPKSPPSPEKERIARHLMTPWNQASFPAPVTISSFNDRGMEAELPHDVSSTPWSNRPAATRAYSDNSVLATVVNTYHRETIIGNRKKSRVAESRFGHGIGGVHMESDGVVKGQSLHLSRNSLNKSTKKSHTGTSGTRLEEGAKGFYEERDDAPLNPW